MSGDEPGGGNGGSWFEWVTFPDGGRWVWWLMSSGLGGMAVGGLRDVAAPFVAPGPSGVAVRDRLKHLTPEDEKVLRLVGAHLGSLASKDVKARCMDGLNHSADTWAARKRELTASSSSRWAGSITKATHDDHRGRSGLHQQVGRPALAAAPVHTQP